MRCVLLCVVAVAGLLGPAVLAQNSTPSAPQATTSPSPAQAQSAAPAATPDQPADTLPRQYVDLWNSGDFTQLKSFYSPFMMTSHGHRVRVDAGMLGRVITFWRKSMPDLNFKIADTIIQGDKVAMRLTFTGTYKAVLFPLTASPVEGGPPKTIHGTEMLFFQLKNGKIAEIWEEYDELVMRQQMGGIWSMPKKAMAPASKASPKPAPPTLNP